jgi:hypothetical protein
MGADPVAHGSCLFRWASHSGESFAQARDKTAHRRFPSTTALFPQFEKKLVSVDTALVPALGERAIKRSERASSSRAWRWLDRPFSTQVLAHRIAGKMQYIRNLIGGVSLLLHRFRLIAPPPACVRVSQEKRSGMILALPVVGGVQLTHL